MLDSLTPCPSPEGRGEITAVNDLSIIYRTLNKVAITATANLPGRNERCMLDCPDIM